MGMEIKKEIMKYKNILYYLNSITCSKRNNKNKNLKIHLYPKYLMNSKYFSIFLNRKYKNHKFSNSTFLKSSESSINSNSNFNLIKHSLYIVLYFFYLTFNFKSLLYKKNMSGLAITSNPYQHLYHLKNLKYFFLLSSDKLNKDMKHLNTTLLDIRDWMLFESHYQHLNNQYRQKYSDYINHVSIFRMNNKLFYSEFVDRLVEGFKDRALLENKSVGIETKTYPFISTQIIQKFENTCFSTYINYKYNILA